LGVVEGSTGDVDEVVVNVGEAGIVCDKVKVFGDLLDVWLWNDGVEEEIEVVRDDDEGNVGDESHDAVEESVIFLSLIGVFVMVMPREPEWAQLEL